MTTLELILAFAAFLALLWTVERMHARHVERPADDDEATP